MSNFAPPFQSTFISALPFIKFFQYFKQVFSYFPFVHSLCSFCMDFWQKFA
jgi:hypothetical protein